jgi:hypothetical protein
MFLTAKVWAEFAWLDTSYKLAPVSLSQDAKEK